MKNQRFAVRKFAIRPSALRGLMIALAFATALCVPSVLAASPPKKPVPLSGSVTLKNRHDPLHSSFGFTTANFGTIKRDGTLYNVNSQITFDEYERDKLTVAVQGRERAGIQRVESDTLSGEALFSALKRKDAKIHVGEAVALEAATPDGEKKSKSPSLGAVFVIRIDNVSVGNQKVAEGKQAYFKILVTDFQKGQSVTFRWAMM